MDDDGRDFERSEYIRIRRRETGRGREAALTDGSPGQISCDIVMNGSQEN